MRDVRVIADQHAVDVKFVSHENAGFDSPVFDAKRLPRQDVPGEQA